MPVRKANAAWKGGLKDGDGNIQLESGSYSGAYSFSSRFENGSGTNPEELIAGAHAGCFSMAFSLELEKAGYKPVSVETEARVSIDKTGDGFSITKIVLNTKGNIPGIKEDEFQKLANNAKVGCPVSKLFKGADIQLEAKLV